MKSKILKQYKNIILWSILGFCMLIGFGMVVFGIWQKYKNDIIDKQKEQMLIIAESLASNLQGTMDSYMGDIERLAGLLEYNKSEVHSTELEKKILSEYVEDEKEYVSNVILYEKDGTPEWENADMMLTELFGSWELKDSGLLMKEGRGSDGRIYIVLNRQIQGGESLEMFIDVEEYYTKLISRIRLGTNGYVMVKNSEGIIFMHPETQQLGKTVIEDRREMYPGRDLTSLEELVKEQNENISGVFEYYSYWWTNPEIPKVKKISAYDRATFGEDYLIISAVMDYSDFYEPIAKGFTSIGMAFACILIIFLIALCVMFYMTVQRQKNRDEIVYLRDLNHVLEETKRGEEVIAHQQRLQIMGTMTGGIAHEFNNMLTPIMGYSEMLLDELPPGSDGYEFAEEILQASDKAKDVIRQISGLSRRNMETVFHMIPFSAMLRRTMKMIQAVCPQNVQIEQHSSLKGESFLGNETQINQVLLNLSVNAFHAIGTEKKGQVIFTADQADRASLKGKWNIEIPEEVEQLIQIQVRDNGCGMEKETIDQIFTPFFTTKVGGQGTGLGLSVVEQIIHSHKGYIFVESEVGEGSCFTILLPEIPVEGVAQIENQQEQLEHLRILVVDDNEKISRLLEKRFKKIGVEVCGTNNTTEAKNLLEMQHFDVLLIDQYLSKSGAENNGIYLAMSLNGRFPHMVKIIMTDQVKKEIIEAKQQGIIDAYLEKPVSDTEIVEVMRKLSK